jgi:hypothetical protein
MVAKSQRCKYCKLQFTAYALKRHDCSEKKRLEEEERCKVLCTVCPGGVYVAKKHYNRHVSRFHKDLAVRMSLVVYINGSGGK